MLSRVVKEGHGFNREVLGAEKTEQRAERRACTCSGEHGDEEEIDLGAHGESYVRCAAQDTSGVPYGPRISGLNTSLKIFDLGRTHQVSPLLCGCRSCLGAQCPPSRPAGGPSRGRPLTSSGGGPIPDSH